MFKTNWHNINSRSTWYW